MADYWKSQPRKFCDFCKCWIADNKPSRDFHERGKRHQESVAKKISELRKKGFEKAKNEKDEAEWMIQMEKEAMKKLREDLTSDPSLAAQYGVTIKGRNKEEEKPETTSSSSAENDPKSTDVSGDWQEELSDEGYVYFWNTVTGETRWELPVNNDSEVVPSNESAEPVLSQKPGEDAESQKQSDNSLWQKLVSSEGYPYFWNTKTGDVCWELPAASTETDGKVLPKTESKSSETTTEKVPSDLKEDSASDETEPVVSAIKKEAEQEPAAKISEFSKPKPVHRVYGEWQELKEESEELIDLELPVNQNRVEVNTIVLSAEPKLRFKEKTVGSLGVRGMEHKTVEFKKRKLNSGAAKGNRRQANNDLDS